ncbi:hypothetical protein [Mesorhizobium sp.]|uniref:hypothetical protein n=1 Tax=Mesorhizobium sp. TaxID=1871066 RepID=UPI00257D7DE2|nr:hypothetical protein [Mesorhizobium sp.]
MTFFSSRVIPRLALPAVAAIAMNSSSRDISLYLMLRGVMPLDTNSGSYRREK